MPTGRRRTAAAAAARRRGNQHQPQDEEEEEAEQRQQQQQEETREDSSSSQPPMKQEQNQQQQHSNEQNAAELIPPRGARLIPDDEEVEEDNDEDDEDDDGASNQTQPLQLAGGDADDDDDDDDDDDEDLEETSFAISESTAFGSNMGSRAASAAVSTQQLQRHRDGDNEEDDEDEEGDRDQGSNTSFEEDASLSSSGDEDEQKQDDDDDDARSLNSDAAAADSDDDDEEGNGDFDNANDEEEQESASSDDDDADDAAARKPHHHQKSTTANNKSGSSSDNDEEDEDDDDDDDDEDEDAPTSKLRLLRMDTQNRKVDDNTMPAANRILGFAYEPITEGLPSGTRRRQREEEKQQQRHLEKLPKKNTGDDDDEDGGDDDYQQQQNEQQLDDSASSLYAPYRDTSSMLGLRCYEPAATNRRQSLLHFAVTPHIRKSSIGAAEDVVTFNEIRIALLCECIRHYEAFGGCFVGLADRCRVALHFVIVEERNLPWENASGVPLTKSNAADVYRWCLESLAALLQTTFATMSTCAVVFRAAAQPTFEEAASMDGGVEPNATIVSGLVSVACKLGAIGAAEGPAAVSTLALMKKAGSSSSQSRASSSRSQQQQKQQQQNQQGVPQRRVIEVDGAVLKVPLASRRLARDALFSSGCILDNPFSKDPPQRQRRVVALLETLMDTVVASLQDALENQISSKNKNKQPQSPATTTTAEAADNNNNNNNNNKSSTAAAAHRKSGKTEQQIRIHLHELIEEPAAREQALLFLKKGKELVSQFLVPLLSGDDEKVVEFVAAKKQQKQLGDDDLLTPLLDPVSFTQQMRVEAAQQQQHKKESSQDLQRQHHHHHHHRRTLNLRFSAEAADTSSSSSSSVSSPPPITTLASKHLRGDQETVTSLQRAFAGDIFPRGGGSGGASDSSASSSSSMSLSGIPSSLVIPITLLLDAAWRVTRAVDDNMPDAAWRSICDNVGAIAAPFLVLRFLLPFASARGFSYGDSHLSGDSAQSCIWLKGQHPSGGSSASKSNKNSSSNNIARMVPSGGVITAGGGGAAATGLASGAQSLASLNGLQVWLAAQIRDAVAAAGQQPNSVSVASPFRSMHLACLSHLPRLVVDLLMAAGRAIELSPTTKSFVSVVGAVKQQQAAAVVAAGGGVRFGEMSTPAQHLSDFADCVRRNTVARFDDDYDDEKRTEQRHCEEEALFYLGGRGGRLFVGVWE